MGCLALAFAAVGGLLLWGVPGVGPVLAVVWVAGCFLASRSIRSAPALVDTNAQNDVVVEPHAVRVTGPKDGTKDHVPPHPAGEPREPWSPDARELEVAGEWYRRDHLRELFSREDALSPEGAELRHPAALVPDPTNPYDSRAVAVYVQGYHVGYMERSDAARYQQVIAGMNAGGVQTMVRSRQWVRAKGHDLWARVTIWLPEPDAFAPANPLLLPTGTAVQATREDEHLDVLAPFLAGSSRVPVAATLHEVTEQRPRSTVQVVEVRIDGQRVGVLSPTQTSNLLALVRLADRDSRTATARAVVRGNSLKADVTLLSPEHRTSRPTGSLPTALDHQRRQTRALTRCQGCARSTLRRRCAPSDPRWRDDAPFRSPAGPHPGAPGSRPRPGAKPFTCPRGGPGPTRGKPSPRLRTRHRPGHHLTTPAQDGRDHGPDVETPVRPATHPCHLNRLTRRREKATSRNHRRWIRVQSNRRACVTVTVSA